MQTSSEKELETRKTLKDELKQFNDFLLKLDPNANNAQELIATRMNGLGYLTREIEAQYSDSPEELLALQDYFRAETDPVLGLSWIIYRARHWPEGYPGDYVTLESVYANEPKAVSDLGRALDRYMFSTSELAIAVRSRLRKLTQILVEFRLGSENEGDWLNIACGSCRELLKVPPSIKKQVWCVDQDPKALYYATQLLQTSGYSEKNTKFVCANAFKMFRDPIMRERTVPFSLIYSAGLFDYVKSDHLVSFLKRCYNALTPGGMLITPFKDRRRYSTFFYHWIMKWNFFIQRTEEEFYDILDQAGIPSDKLRVERDPSGVILFFTATK